jgi:hypothetical protein
MNNTQTKPTELYLEPLEVDDDYYREEACPIDGRIRKQSHAERMQETIFDVKEALLKCFFDSTNGVITKQDWFWMLGIGVTGAIAFTTLKSVMLPTTDIIPTQDASLEQQTSGY